MKRLPARKAPVYDEQSLRERLLEFLEISDAYELRNLVQVFGNKVLTTSTIEKMAEEGLLVLSDGIVTR